jgi:hypothetical protein
VYYRIAELITGPATSANHSASTEGSRPPLFNVQQQILESFFQLSVHDKIKKFYPEFGTYFV